MKKSIAILLAVCLCASLWACSDDSAQAPDIGTTTVAPSESEAGTTEPSATEVGATGANEPEIETPVPVQTGLKDASGIQKIDTVDLDFTDFTAAGAVYTGENGLKGIYYDSANMTEPKYVSCQSNGTLDSQWNGYFKVSATPSSEITTISQLNQYGVVAGGQEIVPMKYAYIKHLNDRYFYVCKVTGQTTNRDEALLYSSDAYFQLPFTGPKDDDTLLEGVWYIYDTIDQELVPGATGTKSTSQKAYGNILMYQTDSGETVYVNDLGETLPADIQVFSNGCYRFKTGKVGALYDAHQNLLFDRTDDGLTLDSLQGEYILAHKYGGKVKHVLLDLEGNIVSAEFTSTPRVYGSLLLVDKKLYDLNGNPVIDIECNSVSFDKQWENAWALHHTDDGIDTVTVINKEGSVLYQGTDSFNSSYFSIDKIADNTKDTLFYSYADQDFTITADDPYSNWLVVAVRKNADSKNVYDLYDTVSGEQLLRDYRYYNFVTKPGKAIYVYAANQDGTYDIYIIE